jgi:signal transduction histidine kinase
MKMRSGFFVIAILAFILGTITIFPIIETSLKWSVDRLSSAQRENVRRFLAESINDKKVYLQNLRNLIQSDANLAGALVLADASHDYTMFNEQINEFRHKSNLEYFALLPAHKIHSTNATVENCLAEFVKTDAGEALCKNGEHVFLALISPVYLYGKHVGTMFLGANLDEGANSKAAHGESQQPLFSLIKNSENVENEVYRVDSNAVVADLKPNNETINSVAATLRKVILFGSTIALVFILIFITLGLRYFFLEPFQSILSDLGRAFSHIEGQKEFTFHRPPFLLRENKRLLGALETFITKITNYERRLVESNKKLIDSEKNAAIGRTSRQVAHDIRSPLTALQLILRAADQFPESHRELLVQAVSRINNIANELLKTYRSNSVKSEIAPPAISPVDEYIHLCAQEKSLLANDKKIKINISSRVGAGATVLMAAVTFQNIISNLLSNAIEASEEKTSIQIEYAKVGGFIHITIKDQGKGIPEDILKRLGNEELSFGKSEGNGLGLFSAKQAVEATGGKFLIRSEVGRGTTVEMQLVAAKNQVRYVEKVKIHHSAKIIVIDDDKTVHEVWRHRLNEIATSQTVFISNIMTASQFEAWFASNGVGASKSKYQYFVDYDFHNSDFTGIDLIEKYNLASQSVLVTAHYAENDVADQAAALNVPILPKPSLATIPFDVDS